ncbi:MAG: SCO family protein [Burkholderiales bacterium]|nr:SCO family protein [Burkholderiales bacterium]OJX06328.1 MAG: electron transporter SenC [Burkholderiales bacterium 70-64]
MLRTAVATVCLALACAFAGGWLTHGFRVWTAEGARRLEVVRHPVAVPAVRAVGPGIDGARPLPEWLGDDGGVTLVDFVYTRCRAVCAALGSGFQQLQARIGAAPAGSPDTRVRLLSISFDPGHDDVAVLQRYAAELKADARIWRFATVPDAGELRRLLGLFQVVVIPDGLGGYEHNAALLVLDGRGRLVRIFDYARIDDALHFARALAADEERG